MTNEEARAYFIDNIEEIITTMKDENSYNYETQQIEPAYARRDFEAKELAIKALGQQPCEDCIDRAEVLMHSHIEYDDDGVGHRVIYAEDIEDLPSVTPKARWIPVSERLPKKDETEVLITLKEDGSVLQATYLDDMTFDTEAYGWFAIKDISAWMLLPKPYEEGEDEK